MGNSENFDVVIIGGGVAGISAAFWCNELGLSSVILESEKELGGQLLWTYNAIKNYLGIEAENGRELQKIFLNQIEKRNLSIKTNTKVSQIDTKNKTVLLEDGKILSAKFLVIATGIRRRKLNVAGEEAFQGKGILRSGKRDAELVRGKNVCVIGGGDAAVENALILAETAEKVTLIHRRKNFRAREEFIEKVKLNPKITVLTEMEITKIIGDESLEAIELKQITTNQTQIYQTDALLLRIGVEPNNELFRGQIELDKNGYCLIDSNCETSAMDVFAIGDIANPAAPTISSAVGMGATVSKVIETRQK
ncbi:MAG: NAD(P)/FAD-dependent oxidoreductase [Pyrinomonadaceae bacterium]|nr:NAD(P)/FAD-dependent oxidoreductase [Pyrinomonadaceae bacterium]